MNNLKSFSKSALQTILLAEEESRRLGHNFVGGEQLLIGLLSTDNGAAQLLLAAGVTLEGVRVEVEKIIGRGSGFVAPEIPFTPNAKRALEQAIETACRRRTLVEPEHILLAITSSVSEMTLRVLENLGVSIPQLTKAILTQLSSLPQQQVFQGGAGFEFQTPMVSSIPSTDQIAPKMVDIVVLPQEGGRSCCSSQS